MNSWQQLAGPDMGVVLFVVSVAALLVIVIGVHEYGHCIVAKLVGIGVDEFALGFGPRLGGFSTSNTRYSIRLIPAGGYARLKGMVPGDRDTEPDSFYQASRWRRAAAILAGVVFNFAFAGVCFMVALLLPLSSAYGPGEAAHRAGLRNGDNIVAVDGIPIPAAPPSATDAAYFRATSAAMGHPVEVTYVRNGKTRHALVHPELLLANVSPGPHDSLPLGLLVITSVDGRPVGTGPPGSVVMDGAKVTLAGYVLTANGGKGKSFTGTDQGIEAATSIALGANQVAWKLGVSPGEPGANLWQALTNGYRDVGLTTIGTVQGIIYLASTPKSGGITGPNGLVGPVGVAQIADTAAQEGWASYISTIGLISVSLGLLNALPVPFLDGGRLLFVLIETLRRKRVNPVTEAVVHAIGLAFILVFAIYITVGDISRL